MRTILMLTFLLIAGTCFAEDPLESLNTVEDTLNTMEHVLDAQGNKGEPAAEKGGTLPGAAQRGELPGQGGYFVSDEPLGVRGWVAVRPCLGEEGSPRAAAGPESCADETGEAGGYFWESRAAQVAELKPGVLVVARQEQGGGWVMARITSVSEVAKGEVAVSGPFRLQVKGLRIVEE